MNDVGRIAPMQEREEWRSDVAAEQSVLGGLLLDNAAASRIAPAIITAESFYRADHRRIFRHIAALIDSGEPADVLTVAATLEAAGKLEEVGGHGYLGSLAANTAGVANIENYAKRVAKHARKRTLAAICNEVRDAVQAGVDPDEAQADLIERAQALADGTPFGAGARVLQLDPRKSRLGDALDNPPPPPQFLVERHLPLNVGTEVGTGGLSKTTRHQREHINIVLGLPLYGRKVLQPAPTLILTKEDQRSDFEYRYSRIAAAMGLSENQRRLIKEHLHVEDLIGTGARLAIADQGGNLVRTTLAEKIIRAYRGEGIGLVDIDPLNHFSPGERFVNDGEAIMMEAGLYIASELKCCVRITGHVSKDAARNRLVDAHAGRGGAAGSDNARFVHVAVRHDPADEKQYPRPKDVSPEDIAAGRVFRLHMPKISGAPQTTEPIWLAREPDGYLLRHIDADPVTDTEREADDIHRVREFLSAELKRSIKHTSKTLEDARAKVGLSRDKLRYVLNVAEQKGHLLLSPLPEEERKGAKTHYWHPVGFRDMAAR